MVTTTTVNIGAVLPDDAAPEGATITFTLSRTGSETDVVIPDAVVVDLDSSGSGSVALWPNEMDEPGSAYSVSVSYYRASPFLSSDMTTRVLGSVFVPVAGPVQLGDLLAEFSGSSNFDWGSVADAAATSADYGDI